MIDRRGPIEPALGAEIVAQAAAALDQAHSRGLIHRDVKPANLLIQESDGKPHVDLTDFGLTKRTDSQTVMTATGMFVGTVDYISPEQVNGEAVDARADVYALGGVLFDTLTGKVPYPKPADTAKLVAHVSEAPPRPTDHLAGLPESLDEVVTRAMAKEIDDRYLSAGDLGRAATAAAARGASVTRAERSVAAGEAAAPTATAVAPPPPPNEPRVATPPVQPAPRPAAPVAPRAATAPTALAVRLGATSLLCGALIFVAPFLPFYKFSTLTGNSVNRIDIHRLGGSGSGVDRGGPLGDRSGGPPARTRSRHPKAVTSARRGNFRRARRAGRDRDLRARDRDDSASIERA